MPEKDQNFTELLEYIIDDDPSAELVISTLLYTDRLSFVDTVNKLEELDIRGSSLWKLFEESHMDAKALRKYVLSRWNYTQSKQDNTLAKD